MKRLILLGAIWALAVARPELYKEKEDFQFSRSSSDDGSKSGFYGAQRGNMGGNYERAHNMDSVAQNQMSGLVRQVEGELGDGAKTRTGSVYTAANSRGTYGSGNFDLSNLEGRNFQEGSFYDDTHAHSSLSSSSAYNAAGYTNSRSQNSRGRGYQAVGSSGLNVPSDDLQSLDNSQGTGQYAYDRQASHSAGYNSQSGFQQHSSFDTSNADAQYRGYGSNAQTRLISATPVRIIVRPGTRVAIPVAAQTYNVGHGSSLIDQNSLSDAEVLSNDNQRTLYRPGSAKHYESSYNYRKEWEKHDTVPSAVTLPTTPTENPFPKNSELYEDRQAHTAGGHYDASRVDSQRAQSRNTYGGYNVKSASRQSSSDYDRQHQGSSLYSNTNAYTSAGHNAGSNHHAASSDSSLSDNIQSQYNTRSNSNAFTQAGQNTGFNTDLNSQVENLNAKPKSYQSSYSYHKSWEHQGDPYVIKPASSAYYDGQSSQRLTTGSSKNQAYATTGSHYQHSHQSGADCDENGHIRVARSYNSDQYVEVQQQSQDIEDMGQQVQDMSQQVQDMGQQVQDLGQQSQNQWGQQEVGQQSQNKWDHLEDLSQQSHKQWDEIHKKWDRFENLGQNVENSWGQKSQSSNNQLEDLEQKHQNDLGQHSQDIGVEVKHDQSAVQGGQGKRDFSNIGQHGLENYQNRDIHYEQSHKLNHQENQRELKEFEPFNHSQQSQRHNDNKEDQLSLWEQGVVNRDHKPHNSMSQSDKPSQLESHKNNFDFETFLEEFTRNTQQTYKIPGTNDQSNTYFKSDSSYSNFFPRDENSFQIPDKLYEINDETISSSHNEEISTNSNSYSHIQRIPPNTAPLLSLWNKLDNIEKQSTLSNNRNISDGNDFSQVNISQNSYQNSRQKGTNDTNSTFTAYHYNQIKPHTEYQNQPNVAIQTDKEHLQDIGRGDIGPEDVTDLEVDKKPYLLDTSVTEKPIQNVNNTIEKDHLLPSLLGMSGLISENSQVHKNNEKEVSNGTHTNPQNTSFHLQKQDENQQSSFNLQEFDQKNMQHSDQTNSDQQRNFLQDFGQLETLEQQNIQDFGQQENVEQQNLQNFEQQENVEQQNLQNFGQKENVEQQNLQNFGQQENLEQQNLQNFGQQENLEQQNLQNFRQQENLEQQNLQNFGQQENLEQQNLQNFGQQENLEQQNLQNFVKQENLDQQNLKNVGQQENLEQQNLQDFGQHENLEQQNLQTFVPQENFEQQNLKNDGQQENLEQQNFQDFGHHGNLEQQNLQTFGSQENLEQQNLQNFGQQENLEQQNLQNFGQQENLEQQNLQNFRQQENLDQQNLKHLTQEEYLQQQNLQDFGQQENLEQQNLNHFEPQTGNFEEQNMNTNEFFYQQNLEQLSQSSKLNVQYPDKLEQQTYKKKNIKPQINLPHPEEEFIQVKKQNSELQSIPVQSQNTVAVLPIEPVTEKPGFWKSVGNKLSDAKGKIASWFKS